MPCIKRACSLTALPTSRLADPGPYSAAFLLNASRAVALDVDGSERGVTTADVNMAHVHSRCCLLQPVANQRRLRAGFLRETKPELGLRQRRPGLTSKKQNGWWTLRVWISPGGSSSTWPTVSVCRVMIMPCSSSVSKSPSPKSGWSNSHCPVNGDVGENRCPVVRPRLIAEPDPGGHYAIAVVCPESWRTKSLRQQLLANIVINHFHGNS